ncbi:DVU3141 family protein [Salinicola endophyticus]|uniref:DVU3141 family protein n=1 Tax=Salinicola endophyticus TaxID=1949083 RepID=A0AB74U603_9GAMM
MSNAFHGVSRRVGRLGKFFQLGVLSVAIAGCATQSQQGIHNVQNMRGAAALGPEISTFLDNATPGSIAAFPKSPWGSNVSVIVQERYFAASGRLCAHLDIARESGAALHQAEVACLVKNNGWFSQRLVTQVLPATSNQ